VQTCIWPSWCHFHSLSLASIKSRLILPFSYRLTWIVPEKGPLNWCIFVSFVVVNIRVEEVTLNDVRSIIGRRGKCRYHFLSQRSDRGIVKKEVNQQKFFEYHLFLPFLYNSVTWLKCRKIDRILQFSVKFLSSIIVAISRLLSQYLSHLWYGVYCVLQTYGYLLSHRTLLLFDG